MGQATVPDESWADVSVHGFWKWGTTALFDMQIFKFICRLLSLSDVCKRPGNGGEGEKGQVTLALYGV